MINSIYTHKEIFLREIISNASDAIDKLSYLSLTDDKRGHQPRPVCHHAGSRTRRSGLLTVSDNGIGMDQSELENNLGVIASSGSLRLPTGDARARPPRTPTLSASSAWASTPRSWWPMRSPSSPESMVEEQAWRWQSTGVDGYTIEPCEKETVGTDIIMHIKADGEEKEEYSQYLREHTLYALVKKYSDYIRFPIRMEMPHSVRKEGSSDEKPEYEDEVRVGDA